MRRSRISRPRPHPDSLRSAISSTRSRSGVVMLASRCSSAVAHARSARRRGRGMAARPRCRRCRWVRSGDRDRRMGGDPRPVLAAADCQRVEAGVHRSQVVEQQLGAPAADRHARAARVEHATAGDRRAVSGGACGEFDGAGYQPAGALLDRPAMAVDRLGDGRAGDQLDLSRRTSRTRRSGGPCGPVGPSPPVGPVRSGRAGRQVGAGTRERQRRWAVCVVVACDPKRRGARALGLGRS